MLRPLILLLFLASVPLLTVAADAKGTWMCAHPDADVKDAVPCDSDEHAGVQCPESSCGEAIRKRRVFCKGSKSPVSPAEECDLSNVPESIVKCPKDASGCHKDVIGTRCNRNDKGRVDRKLENITCRPSNKPDLKAYRIASCTVDEKSRYPADSDLCGSEKDLLTECRLQSCDDPVEFEWVYVPTSPCINDNSLCESFGFAEIRCSTKGRHVKDDDGTDGTVVDDSFCDSELKPKFNAFQCTPENSPLRECATTMCNAETAEFDGVKWEGFNFGQCICDMEGLTGDYCEHDHGGTILSVHIVDKRHVYISTYSENNKGTEHVHMNIYAWEGSSTKFPVDDKDRILIGKVYAIEPFLLVDISSFEDFTGKVTIGGFFGGDIGGFFGDDTDAFFTSYTFDLNDLCKNVSCGSNKECMKGECVCKPGFSGDNCEIDACDELQCGDHGSCAAGVCVCEQGWAGETCDKEADCSKFNDCSGHGRCNSTNQCECDPGYFDIACDYSACEDLKCPHDKQTCSIDAESGSPSCACPVADDGSKLYADTECEVPTECVAVCAKRDGISGVIDFANNTTTCDCNCPGFFESPSCKTCGIPSDQCRHNSKPNRECSSCECSSASTGWHGLDCSCRLVRVQLALAAPSSGSLDGKDVLKGLADDVKEAVNSTKAVVLHGRMSKAVDTKDGKFHALSFLLGVDCKAPAFAGSDDEDDTDESQSVRSFVVKDDSSDGGNDDDGDGGESEPENDENPDDTTAAHDLVSALVAAFNANSTDSLSILGSVAKDKGIGLHDRNCNGDNCPQDVGDGGRFEGSEDAKDFDAQSGMSNSTKLAIGLGVGLGFLVIIAIIVIVCLLTKKEEEPPAPEPQTVNNGAYAEEEAPGVQMTSI